MQRIVRTIALLVVMSVEATANSIEFIPLGDLPYGAFNSTPYGLSADGKYAVGSSITGYEDSHGRDWSDAFIWSEDPGMESLGGLPELGGISIFSYAFGIASNGSTVVGMSGSGFNRSDNQAIVLRQGLPPHGLGDLSGIGLRSRAMAVSGDGSIVVGSSRIPGGDTEAFIWTAEEGMRSLRSLSPSPGFGGFDSIATGISDDGKTVVGSMMAAGLSLPFLWTIEDGPSRFYELVPGASGSPAISGDGSTISGDYGRDNAFTWSEERGVIEIHGLPAGNGTSEVKALSQDGTIAVGSSDGGGPFTDAVMWSTNGKPVNLKELLEASGVDMAGWHLRQAQDVSADGRTILGFGWNPQGNSEAWIIRLPIPEPYTGALLCFGFSSLLAMPRGWCHY